MASAPTVCDASHVRNANMDKDVATRLFKMLAVSQQTAATIQRDHASYAKLNLLSQQMNLLQQQASNAVAKSVNAAATAASSTPDAHIQLTAPQHSTAITAEYDENAHRLLTVMAVDDKTLATVQRDAPACAKLSLLAEQASMLQQQAQHAIEESEVNSHLFDVAAAVTCKLVPGTTYYHYTQQGREVVSRIAPNEWSTYEEFHAEYLYDYDLTFRRQPAAAEARDDEQYGAAAPLLLALPQPAAAGGTGAVLQPSCGSEATKPICDVLSRWS